MAGIIFDEEVLTEQPREKFPKDGIQKISDMPPEDFLQPHRSHEETPTHHGSDIALFEDDDIPMHTETHHMTDHSPFIFSFSKEEKDRISAGIQKECMDFIKRLSGDAIPRLMESIITDEVRKHIAKK